MITQLEIKLKYQSEEKLNYNISSVMHGILMGHIDRAYGERMHEDGLKPFVQEVCNIKEDEFIWRICTMTEEAKIQIIEPLMKMDQFYMKHRELRLKVCERNLKEISYDTLIENYYFEEQPRNITIKFCSPTAFKSQGNYIFMPTVRLIFQSLIHKYDTFSSDLWKKLWILPGLLHFSLVRTPGYQLLPVHPPDRPPADHPYLQ